MQDRLVDEFLNLAKKESPALKFKIGHDKREPCYGPFFK